MWNAEAPSHRAEDWLIIAPVREAATPTHCGGGGHGPARTVWMKATQRQRSPIPLWSDAFGKVPEEHRFQEPLWVITRVIALENFGCVRRAGGRLRGSLDGLGRGLRWKD